MIGSKPGSAVSARAIAREALEVAIVVPRARGQHASRRGLPGGPFPVAGDDVSGAALTLGASLDAPGDDGTGLRSPDGAELFEPSSRAAPVGPAGAPYSESSAELEQPDTSSAIPTVPTPSH